MAQKQYFKKYLLYIYFHKVNTFLGDAAFNKFLNAFDMKYNKKNNKGIYDCSNEGIFIACMGLSKRAAYITKENIDIGLIEGHAAAVFLYKLQQFIYNGLYFRGGNILEDKLVKLNLSTIFNLSQDNLRKK